MTCFLSGDRLMMKGVALPIDVVYHDLSLEYFIIIYLSIIPLSVFLSVLSVFIGLVEFLNSKLSVFMGLRVFNLNRNWRSVYGCLCSSN